jgi:N-acetylmuramoyl-L-alanine amidase
VGTITGGSTTRYDILGKDAATATWYQIRFSSTVTGWVHKDYIQTHGSLSGLTVTWTPPRLSLLATTTQNLNVRSGPGTSHSVVGTITGGSTTRYDILGKNAATATWYQIRFSSTVTGWVFATYVQTHGDVSGVPVR